LKVINQAVTSQKNQNKKVKNMMLPNFVKLPVGKTSSVSNMGSGNQNHMSQAKSHKTHALKKIILLTLMTISPASAAAELRWKNVFLQVSKLLVILILISNYYFHPLINLFCPRSSICLHERLAQFHEHLRRFSRVPMQVREHKIIN